MFQNLVRKLNSPALFKNLNYVFWILWIIINCVLIRQNIGGMAGICNQTRVEEHNKPWVTNLIQSQWFRKFLGKVIKLYFDLIKMHSTKSKIFLRKKVNNSINLEKVHLRITQKSSMYHLMLIERNSVLSMKVTRNITCDGIIRQRIDYLL